MYAFLCFLTLLVVAPASTINDRWPRFSPDGRFIAFNTTRTGDPQIDVMHADGTGLTQVTHNASAQEKIGGVGWLPWGNLLFFTYASAALDRSDNDVVADRFIEATLNGTNVRVLYEGMNQDRPSASPSGDALAFEGAHGSWSSNPPIDVYRFDLKTLTLHALTHADGEYVQAAWSSDGKKIAFGCSKHGDIAMQICIMNRDGTHMVAVTHGKGSRQWPSWSPDSQHLAFFIENKNGQAIDSDIATIDINGRNERILTHHNGTQRNETPDWSPDGKRIVFQTDRAGNGFRIAVMNVDGSDFRMLTN